MARRVNVPVLTNCVVLCAEEVRSLFESNRLEVAEAAVVTPSVNFRQPELSSSSIFLDSDSTFLKTAPNSDPALILYSK